MNLETKDEGVKETAADIEKEIKSTGEILKDLSLNTVSDSKSESVTATMSHMVVAMASTLGKFCLESFLILHPLGFLFSLILDHISDSGDLLQLVFHTLSPNVICTN